MSISSLINALGQTVTLYEPTNLIDDVGSSVQSFSEGVIRKAYVTASGSSTLNVYGRTQDTKNIRVYFAEYIDIGADWVLKFDNVFFRINQIQNPGKRKDGRLSYCYIDAESDTGANIE